MMSRMIVFAVAALILQVSTAQAQIPSVDPSGAPPASNAPAPQPAAPQQPVFVPLPDQAQQPGEADDTGFYYLPEDLAEPVIDDANQPQITVPNLHEVRQGDTLWDICFLYFNNPWEWPRIWSYNPDITNPHWIYPGDQIQLNPEGTGINDLASAVEESPLPLDIEEPEQPIGDEPVADVDTVPLRPANPRNAVRLRQLAFIEEERRKFAATIVGAVEEKSLLAEGDSVYLDYPSQQPLEPGKRYTIYTETGQVTHPDTGKVIGTYARLLGELRIVSTPTDKRARAVITDSVDVIERGARVGTLQRTFRNVAPTPNQTAVQGTIVARFGSDQLIGQGQVVFVDKGQDDGVRVGNRMFVVRRGDAYGEIMSPSSGIGLDDRRFPARAVGEILVVQTGKRVSAALVTLTLREIGIGDRVLMRKGR